ncbi:MAG: hypothetical protein KAG96_05365 [Ichthyobacteriaceae bacterium]|nr:hypothetical protein [Ichthyobacteriaceae bacterium]
MKKINLLLAVLLFAFTSVNAQEIQEEVDLLQSAIGMEKKNAVAEFITVDGDKSTDFWRLYDEYESKRKDLGKKRINLLKQYAEGYSEMNDNDTKKITNKIISIGESYNSLMKKYYKKIEKKCGIKPASQFFQMELYFQSVIRMTIMEEIPRVPNVKQPVSE